MSLVVCVFFFVMIAALVWECIILLAVLEWDAWENRYIDPIAILMVGGEAMSNLMFSPVENDGAMEGRSASLQEL